MSVPTLSTIEMPLEEMASEAVDALLRRIDESADLRRRVVFDTALVVRGSTAPPGQEERRSD
jgi:LacI family transcriptional regulator